MTIRVPIKINYRLQSKGTLKRVCIFHTKKNTCTAFINERQGSIKQHLP